MGTHANAVGTRYMVQQKHYTAEWFRCPTGAISYLLTGQLGVDLTQDAFQNEDYS